MTKNSIEGYPGESIIDIYLIIDLHFTNMPCIYSTIKFVIQESTKLLAFHQTLWLKVTQSSEAFKLRYD